MATYLFPKSNASPIIPVGGYIVENHQHRSINVAIIEITSSFPVVFKRSSSLLKSVSLASLVMAVSRAKLVLAINGAVAFSFSAEVDAASSMLINHCNNYS